MLVATALLAALCGMSLLAVRSFNEANDVGLAIGVFAVPVLLTGIAAVFSQLRVEPLVQGTCVGLLLACVAIQELMIALAPLIMLFALHFIYAMRHTSEQVRRRRQVWIYCLSAAACGVVLLTWVPLVRDARAGGTVWCFGEDLSTFFILWPITVMASAIAIRQIFASWKHGLIAILSALSPVATYAVVQWLILSFYGTILHHGE